MIDQTKLAFDPTIPKDTLAIILASKKDINTISKKKPGASSALMGIMFQYSIIDPCAPLGPFNVVNFAKENKIEGSAVSFIYKDICDKKPYRFVALIRGQQMGLIPREDIEKIANKEVVTFDFVELIEKIREKIPFYTID